MINRRLLEVAAGRTRRLLVTLPPRHGKSLLISQYFPAWLLGAWPDRRVLLASYEGDFASQWGGRARDALSAHGQEIFGVKLRRASSANGWRVEGRAGGMETAGVGGPLTGKGADVLIIDDPVKNASEAGSRAIRDRTWDWFQSTAYTRLEPAGAIVLIQTRWHGDDLAGRVLAQNQAGGERWSALNLPALAEADDPLGRPVGAPLWPERFSAARLEEIRRSIGAYWWSALYAQRPSPATGGVYQRSWLRYWRRDREFLRCDAGAFRIEECGRWATVDLAISQKRSADFSAILVWALTPTGELLLLDRVKERLSAPKLMQSLVETSNRWRLDYVAIEKVGFQEAIIQQARREGLAVRPLRATGDKVSRAAAASVRFEAGTVYFPESAPWLADLEDELLGFPNVEHDDQVDAVSYACLEASRRQGGTREARTNGCDGDACGTA